MTTRGGNELSNDWATEAHDDETIENFTRKTGRQRTSSLLSRWPFVCGSAAQRTKTGHGTAKGLTNGKS